MRIGIIVVALIGLFGGGLYVANTGQTDDSEQTVSSQSATQLAANTVVYDVRTPEEFAAGHAVDAINLPIESIAEGIYPDVDKDTPIAVYCRSGNRSGQAATILTQAGFTNITDIGAFESLEDYGLATV